MTMWYRANISERIDLVFSGEGGLFVAGRWNYKGKKVVYCSQTISLCTLEWLSHNGLSVSGFSYYRFAIEIAPELIITLDRSDLPENWNAIPSTNTTRDLADIHLFNNKEYLAMAVPSVMVPEETNLIINPTHEAYPDVLKTVRSLGLHSAPARTGTD